jgi:hypothetical protein
MKTKQQFVMNSEQWLGVYRRLEVLKLLLSSDSQPPSKKPMPTAPARINPQGNSIDLQTKNFRLTRVAFWTDNNAIAITHAAAIAEIIKLFIHD